MAEQTVTRVDGKAATRVRTVGGALGPLTTKQLRTFMLFLEDVAAGKSTKSIKDKDQKEEILILIDEFNAYAKHIIDHNESVGAF